MVIKRLAKQEITMYGKWWLTASGGLFLES